MLKKLRVVTAVAVLSSALSTLTAIAQAQSIPIPGLRAFPESVTSTVDGTLFIGRVGDGGIVRANSRTGEVVVFVAPGKAESRSIFGVLADDATNTLWACSNDMSAMGGPSSGADRSSALKGFDLATGAAKHSVPLPGEHAFCNDIAVDSSGAVYVTDSAGPNILRFPFSNNNVFKSIDAKTGRPDIDESKRPKATRAAEFGPSIGGGKNWLPEAWSPRTKLLYVPANNNICGFLQKGKVPEPEAKGFYVGYEAESIFGSIRTAAAADHFGELQAWDLNTGRRAWQHNFKTMFWAPLLVTGGDLVFAGGTPDREFRAFNARTGEQLWSFPAPAGIIGVPTSFEVDGKQYIAVTAGWGLDAQGVQNGIDQIQGTKTVVPKGGTLLVFKLR